MSKQIVTPHKHAAVIRAWADGLEIQRSDFLTNHEWRDLQDGKEPSFVGSTKWRIKPEPPAKVYPVTQMRHEELTNAWNSVSSSWPESAYQFANAAIRHAVDAGQIVSMADHQAALQNLGENLCDVQIERHAARDILIAEAVWNECRRKVLPFGPSMTDIDLAAIIAGVRV